MMNILVVGADYAVLTLIMFHYFTHSLIYCVFVGHAWRPLFVIALVTPSLILDIIMCMCCVGCCTTSGGKLSQGKFQKFRNDM